MAGEPGPIPLVGAPLTPAPAQRPVPPEVQRAAHEFESVFLSEMLGPMFEGLKTDGLGGGGTGEEIFRPLLIERYADAISHAGGVGIADAIVRELMRLQEATTPHQETDHGADR
jgi:peptidoglycan hydrolase FlgJ